jgi:hypothetical protein
MGRTANPIETETIKISTTPPVVEHLKRLVETGLYGKNSSEAAERLISQGIERLIKDGVLKPFTGSRRKSAKP